MSIGSDDTLASAMSGLERRGEATALRTDSGTALSYKELDGRVDRLAGALVQLGLRPSQRFAFILSNGHRILECYLACARTGVVAVPLSDRLAPAELAEQLASSGAKALLFGERASTVLQTPLQSMPAVLISERPDVSTLPGRDVLDYESLLARSEGLAQPSHHPRPEDIACLMYTGGTTGVSKAAMQTQASWAECIRSVIAAWRLSASDRHLVVLPMDHVSWFTTASMLAVGAEILTERAWDPVRVLELVEQERITTLNMIPTMLGDLLAACSRRSPPDLSSLRLLTVAGSPMPPAMYRRAELVFGPIIGSIYGLTETSGPITFLLPEDLSLERLRSGGRPGETVQLKIGEEDIGPTDADTGEILLRGPQVTPGYLGVPEETEAAFIDGWFRTGDIGRIDDEGFLYIVGRSKDMIKTGGFNVYPKEIEDVLYSHPDVSEASVFGLPDDRWIEAVHAAVVPRAPGALIETEVIAYCRERLPGYKVPKAIHFEKRLPRTKVGKLDKHRLRTRYSALESDRETPNRGDEST